MKKKCNKIAFLLILIFATPTLAQRLYDKPNNIFEDTFYTVEPGDTLEDFSFELFRDKKYWKEIAPYNKNIYNPDLIFPNQKIRVSNPPSAENSLEVHAFGENGVSKEPAKEPKSHSSYDISKLDFRYQKTSKIKKMETLNNNTENESLELQIPYLVFQKKPIYKINLPNNTNHDLYRFNDKLLPINTSFPLVQGKQYCIVRLLVSMEITENQIQYFYSIIGKFKPIAKLDSNTYQIKIDKIFREFQKQDQIVNKCNLKFSPSSVNSEKATKLDIKKVKIVSHDKRTLFHKNQFVILFAPKLKAKKNGTIKLTKSGKVIGKIVTVKPFPGGSIGYLKNTVLDFYESLSN